MTTPHDQSSTQTDDGPVASHLLDMPRSVYSGLVDIARQADTLFPFHVGDTYLDPLPQAQMQELNTAEIKRLHHYSPVPGLPALRKAIAKRVETRQQIETTADHVLVTAGATGGLAAAIGAIVEPGDEIIVCAPYWPLSAGIVKMLHAQPKTFVLPDPKQTSATEFLAQLNMHISAKTKAVYINPVHNPTGWILPQAWIEALADWSQQHALWLICDEVYEDFRYTNQSYRYLRSLAPEKTISLHSFSKAYAMAGNRVGYVIAPPELITHIQKLSTHLFYSAPTAAQHAALRVLNEAGDAWLEQTKRRYAQTAEQVANVLDQPVPQGSTFFFLDISHVLASQNNSLDAFLMKVAQQGVLLAPGTACGPFPNSVRMCFTSAHPDKVLEGARRLATHLKLKS